MKKSIIGFLFLFLAAGIQVLHAQQKNPTATFAAENHDFGKINETDGPVTFQFDFTNLGASPLVLKNVQASCGCTTPNWPKEPILPGAKGKILVTYNPSGRPGRFEKTITVTSNGEPETQLIKIMGEVIPKPQTTEDLYPNNIDGFRMKSTQIAINNIAPNGKVKQTVEVYNSTTEPMTVAFNAVPKHIEIKLIPETILPKSKAVIEVTYDAALKNDWGFVFDHITADVNGKTSQNNRISISANIQEDFSILTEEQKKNAPKVEVDNTNFEFGTIKQGDVVKHDYIIKNTGGSDLLIRKLNPSCGCTVANMKSNTVKAGETTTISAEFRSAGKSGNQSKTITVITNDPSNQKLILWVKGTIE